MTQVLFWFLLKTNNFRKWEQAFWVYATIYCGANPSRAKEIWQYITVINTAASSFIWENVYNYDVTFRQLMQFNPTRSWVVMYNHMWSLSMRDPLPSKQTGFVSNKPNSQNRSNYDNLARKGKMSTAGISIKGSNANLVLTANF